MPEPLPGKPMQPTTVRTELERAFGGSRHYAKFRTEVRTPDDQHIHAAIRAGFDSLEGFREFGNRYGKRIAASALIDYIRQIRRIAISHDIEEKDLLEMDAKPPAEVRGIIQKLADDKHAWNAISKSPKPAVIARAINRMRGVALFDNDGNRLTAQDYFSTLGARDLAHLTTLLSVAGESLEGIHAAYYLTEQRGEKMKDIRDMVLLADKAGHELNAVRTLAHKIGVNGTNLWLEHCIEENRMRKKSRKNGG